MQSAKLYRLLLRAFWFVVLVIGVFFVLERMKRAKERRLLSRRTFVPDTAQQLMLYFASVPDTITFAGEDVPISAPFLRTELQERYYSLLLSAADFVSLLQRSYQWRPWVEDALRRKDLPIDFFYLAAVSSHLQMTTDSRAGLWALDTATALAYDLRVSAEIDDRLNVFSSTDAVARRLSSLRTSRGSWTSALLAYCQDKKACFVETLLLSQLLSSPERYGYSIPPRHRVQSLRYSLFRIQNLYISAHAWARRHRIDTTIFRSYNPAVRDLCAPLPYGYLLYLPYRADSTFVQ